MAIEQDELEKIAELARIRIADVQIGEVTQRITEILGMVDQLQAEEAAAVHGSRELLMELIHRLHHAH